MDILMELIEIGVVVLNFSIHRQEGLSIDLL